MVTNHLLTGMILQIREKKVTTGFTSSSTFFFVGKQVNVRWAPKVVINGLFLTASLYKMAEKDGLTGVYNLIYRGYNL